MHIGSPRPEFEDIVPITSADVDFRRKLSLSALTNSLIQVAWKHAEQLGFGSSMMSEQQCFWVLSRCRIQISELPEWNDSIRIISWPKGIHRLFYLRDMELNNPAGKRLAGATTQWLIIDNKTKRPKLFQPEKAVFAANQGRHAIEDEDLLVHMPAGDWTEQIRSPEYSDIDLNHHLTTTRYVEWMLNAFSPDEINRMTITELTLNFIREIPYGQKVCVQKSFDDRSCAYFIRFTEPNEGIVFFAGSLQVDRRID